MATARFSLTLSCPMNSFSRCGRSFSSNEESSSTGAAETMRSFRLGLLFARATEADGSTEKCGTDTRVRRSCSCFWFLLLTWRRDDPSLKKVKSNGGGQECPPHTKLRPNHSDPRALQLGRIEPRDLLSEPDLGVVEFVFLRSGCEVARAQQIGNRTLSKSPKAIGEPSATGGRCENHRLARKVGELAKVFLIFRQRLRPAIGFAEERNRRVQVIDAHNDALHAIGGRAPHALRCLHPPRPRGLGFHYERGR